MSKTEHKKVSQIIGELTVFLLNHGSQDFDIQYKQTAEEEVIKLKTKMIKQQSLEFFKEKMGRQRETEIETYGWSLMGDTELEITGLLIDEMTYEEKNGNLVILLKRKRKQK